MRGTLTHQPLRAPRNSGETLITPPLEDLPQLLESNRQTFEAAQVDLGGHSLQQLRRVARSELISLAVEYTNSYRDIQLDTRLSDETPLILAGHQPQLFHPGVWFKNFALAAAWRLPAVTVNLVVDNDICLRPSIRVPQGSVNTPRVEVFQYDSSIAGVPFEERGLKNRQVFESFGQRVAEAIRPLIAEPLVKKLWPVALERLGEVDNLGLCISQARHRLEQQWRLNTLELPLSRICQTDGFRVFAVHLLRECARLQTDYNSALAEYRKVNRIRSRSHPVPELVSSGDFTETPFWIWTTGEPVRRHLFARVSGTDLQLSDRHGISETIELDGGEFSTAVGQLEELERKHGIKIRPRALITTMFARLVLSDTFFHGIGGAKYDHLTDEIIRRFFGCTPPRFVTMTATAQLPLSLPEITADNVRAAARRVRDAQYHPETFLDNGAFSNRVAELVQSKRHWIAQLPPRGQRARRHREIERINSALRAAIAERQAELEKTCARLVETLRRKAVLASREFSFCLFPQESFKELLLALS